MEKPADIRSLEEQLDAVERDALALAAGLSEEKGTWRERPDSWSVAECLDHLATANRVYVAAMREGAARARAAGKLRRGPALPGIIGGWFAASLEPPVKKRFKLKAPGKIVPRKGPPLADARDAFFSTHQDVRAYLRENADLDLASARFANPFIRGVRFSLATGMHVIVAHERRHLWQGWNVRRAAEGLR